MGNLRFKLTLVWLTCQALAAGVVWFMASAPWAWAIAAALWLMQWWLLDRLLQTACIRPQQALCTAIERVKMQGDLDVRLHVAGGNLGKLGQLFDDLLENFRSIIGKVIFNAHEVATSARALEGMARRVADGSRAQQGAAEAASQAIEQMIANIHGIAEKAGQAARRAGESRELSTHGAQIAQHAADEIERIAQAFNDSATAITQLGQRSQQIDGIASAIGEIAEQTNLLALNAAIEAARAGEQGRGFAVVADEVRKLAERTAVATREIAALVVAIQSETAATIDKVHAGAALSTQGTAQAREAAAALQQISHSSSALLEESTFIAGAIAEQEHASELAGEKMLSILHLAEKNGSEVAAMLGQATHLDHLSENLNEVEKVFKLGVEGEKGLETHRQAIAVVQQAAHKIEQALERAIAQGKIKLEDLMDANYQRIAGVEPPKYHTRFDRLTDELFPAIQEPTLSSHASFVYAGAVDRNGYFPTHNKKFAEEPNGDPAHDLAFSRSKRIFSDPVGKRCGSHDRPFLIQTYRRDTGEVVHDISAPIYVQNQRWGGFRIGYRA
ncbi:MAG: methyl-accepting chemotaxis protein [Pseudomonadota bacterium]